MSRVSGETEGWCLTASGARSKVGSVKLGEDDNDGRLALAVEVGAVESLRTAKRLHKLTSKACHD